LNVTVALVDEPIWATVGAATPLIVTVDPRTAVESAVVATLEAAYAVGLPTGFVKPASVNDAAVPVVVEHVAGRIIATDWPVGVPVVAVVHPAPVNPVPKVIEGLAGTGIEALKATVTVLPATSASPVKAAVHVTGVAPATVELGDTETEVKPEITIAAEPDVTAVESALVATVKPEGP
jgi:hypothetical protein